jgi:hypothetical protein
MTGLREQDEQSRIGLSKQFHSALRREWCGEIGCRRPQQIRPVTNRKRLRTVRREKRDYAATLDTNTREHASILKN